MQAGWWVCGLLVCSIIKCAWQRNVQCCSESKCGRSPVLIKHAECVKLFQHALTYGSNVSKCFHQVFNTCLTCFTPGCYAVLRFVKYPPWDLKTNFRVATFELPLLPALDELDHVWSQTYLGFRQQESLNRLFSEIADVQCPWCGLVKSCEAGHDLDGLRLICTHLLCILDMPAMSVLCICIIWVSFCFSLRMLNCMNCCDAMRPRYGWTSAFSFSGTHHCRNSDSSKLSANAVGSSLVPFGNLTWRWKITNLNT